MLEYNANLRTYINGRGITYTCLWLTLMQKSVRERKVVRDTYFQCTGVGSVSCSSTACEVGKQHWIIHTLEWASKKIRGRNSAVIIVGTMGEFKTAKWLVMLAGRISIIGSYLWIQPIMLNCSASRPSRFVDLNMSIFERIRSVRARAAIDVSIDVLSMYGNLYGHEWYINKNNVTSILLLVHSIK